MLKPYKPKGEMYGVVRDISGGSRLRVFCEDERNRMVRIPGKLKKKMWVRVGDTVVIKKWPIQENEKADLVYRYTKTQKERLIRDGNIPEVLQI
tara:strand:- start:2104 stop:2385 length:282 start_codon:yes stop_codon:yes gene_type:complete